MVSYRSCKSFLKCSVRSQCSSAIEICVTSSRTVNWCNITVEQQNNKHWHFHPAYHLGTWSSITSDVCLKPQAFSSLLSVSSLELVLFSIISVSWKLWFGGQGKIHFPQIARYYIIMKWSGIALLEVKYLDVYSSSFPGAFYFSNFSGHF